MGGCGSPSRKVYGSEEEQDVMMVYTACGEGRDGWRCGGDEDGSQISRGQLSDTGRGMRYGTRKGSHVLDESIGS